MHFWQLKRFWKNHLLCIDDVEWHSFDEISTETAMSIEATVNTLEGEVIQEMKKFIHDYQNIQSNEVKNDLSSFWLRKTKKVVSVIICSIYICIRIHYYVAEFVIMYMHK